MLSKLFDKSNIMSCLIFIINCPRATDNSTSQSRCIARELKHVQGINIAPCRFVGAKSQESSL